MQKIMQMVGFCNWICICFTISRLLLYISLEDSFFLSFWIDDIWGSSRILIDSEKFERHCQSAPLRFLHG